MKLGTAVAAGLLLLAVFLLAPSLIAAESPTGFEVAPEFKSFYDRSGGVRVFGYAFSDAGEEDGRLVQYFERQRLEEHPENAGTPYAILLGRLGAADAEARDLLGEASFAPLSAGGSDENCIYFAETGHRLCAGFKAFWQGRGIEFGDPGVSFRESLALFGYPLSEEFTEDETGLTVQYFERARFEYHAEFAGTENAVLLGRLGDAQFAARKSRFTRRQSTPTPTPTTAPSPTATPTTAPGPTAAPQQSPPPPPAQSIQALVDAAAPGSTVTVPAGIYRETVTINKPITLSGQPGAEIRGSDDWSGGWTRSGNYWVRGTVPTFTGGGYCQSGSNGRCQWPEQVFINGTPLFQVASNPAPGQFAVNGSRQIVLGEDPAGRLVEVTVRPYWINAKSSDVTIQGFTMKHAANPAQYGALSNSDYPRWTIQNNVLSDTHGAVVSLRGASDLKLLNNTITRGGQLGVHGSGAATRNVLIQGNRITQNNTEAFDAGWEAGGIKMAVEVQYITVDGNEVDNNDGKGIWFDWDCNNLTISRNRVHHNTNFGIGLEASFVAKIFGNVVWENGYEYAVWGWGAGILAQSTRDVEIYDNIVAWNADGIVITSQQRQGHTNNVNHYVHDNTIVSPTYGSWDEQSLGWLEDYDGPLTLASSNNRGANNRYWHGSPTSAPTPYFAWGRTNFSLDQLADFNATPGEENGRYLSSTEKDQILSSFGVPVTPPKY